MQSASFRIWIWVVKSSFNVNKSYVASVSVISTWSIKKINEFQYTITVTKREKESVENPHGQS